MDLQGSWINMNQAAVMALRVMMSQPQQLEVCCAEKAADWGYCCKELLLACAGGGGLVVVCDCTILSVKLICCWYCMYAHQLADPL
jgi:hypothetical protein